MSSPRRPSDKLTFRADDHTYWLGEPDVGVKLYGANELLKSVGLIDTSHFTPGSAERGTLAHRATELYDDPEWTLDEDNLDEALRPYLTAYKKFSDVCQPEWTGVEQKLCDKSLRIAGTVDRVGTMRPGGTGRKQRVVVDLKTGSFAPWHSIQLACYQHLATVQLVLGGAVPPSKVASKPLVERYALYLTKKGTYSLKHFTEVTDIAVLMGARAVCLWKETHGFTR